MNNPNQNNYIQYLTTNDVVKTRNVVFFDDGTTTSFEVSGIIEDFFILAVFQNNIRVYGVGFDDIENNDMLGFLNSDISDISLIPKNAFMPSEQIVTMSYNNEYLKSLTASPVNFPAVQTVSVNNMPAVQTVSVNNMPAVQTVSVNNMPAVQTASINNFPATQNVTIVDVLQKYKFPIIRHEANLLNNYAFGDGSNRTLEGYECVFITFVDSVNLKVRYVSSVYFPFPTEKLMDFDILQMQNKIIRIGDAFIQFTNAGLENLAGFYSRVYHNPTTNETIVMSAQGSNDGMVRDTYQATNVLKGFEIPAINGLTTKISVTSGF